MNVERDFSAVFRSVHRVGGREIPRGEYFLDEIQDRRWDYLIYENALWLAIPSVVAKFYTSFAEGGYSAANHRIELSWDGRTLAVDAPLISRITGIPIGHSYEPLRDLAYYASFMGPACTLEDGGVVAATVYKNVHTCARWVNSNLISTQHHTHFYAPCLQIVHALMFNRQFCLCSWIVGRLAASLSGGGFARYMPVLVTEICKRLLGEEDFVAHLIETPQVPVHIRRESIGRAYSSTRFCVVNWTPALRSEEEIRAEDVGGFDLESSDSSTERFFAQPAPPADGGDRAWLGLQRMWRKLKGLKKVLKEAVEDLSCLRSETVGVPERSSSRLAGRGGGRRGRGRRGRGR